MPRKVKYFTYGARGGRREMAVATVYQKHRAMLNRKMMYMA